MSKIIKEIKLSNTGAPDTFSPPDRYLYIAAVLAITGLNAYRYYLWIKLKKGKYYGIINRW